jgi:6-phosphogluconolactonase (cycloisomerase 2 family)
MLGLKARPRRAIVHPNGKYLYVLHEVIGNIQVYPVSETGTMDPVCLQEITAVDPEAYQAWFIGVALSSGSELEAGPDNLYLSIRGMAAPGGRCESGLRLLSYHDDGARLELGDMIETPAAVRHFSKVGDTLWVGLNSKTKTLVQKYTKASNDDKFTLKGEANVGFDVMCVVPFDP